MSIQKTPDAIRQQRRREKVKAASMKWVRLLVHESWEPYLKTKIEPACKDKKK